MPRNRRANSRNNRGAVTRAGGEALGRPAGAENENLDAGGHLANNEGGDDLEQLARDPSPPPPPRNTREQPRVVPPPAPEADDLAPGPRNEPLGRGRDGQGQHFPRHQKGGVTPYHKKKNWNKKSSDDNTTLLLKKFEDMNQKYDKLIQEKEREEKDRNETKRLEKLVRKVFAEGSVANSYPGPVMPPLPPYQSPCMPPHPHHQQCMPPPMVLPHHHSPLVPSYLHQYLAALASAGQMHAPRNHY